LKASVARYLGKLENFIVLCGYFIQDTAYQFLSKSVKYCRSSDKKLWCVFMPHSVYTL